MAEIHITAFRATGVGGPSLPTTHSAFLSGIRITPTGDELPCLKMLIGDCTISVWPVDAVAISALAEDLGTIVRKIGGEVNCTCGGEKCAGHGVSA